jgi:succinyl-diaminopimelate desuccinylase
VIQEKINQYFENRDKEFIDTLSKLIAVKSVRTESLPSMPFGKGPADALALGLRIAKEMGFATRNYDNYVGTVDLNDKETKLAILCHLDVVGEGTGWSTPPYTGVFKEGMLYGRGACDDKGPTVASIFAMKAVKDMGIPLKFNSRLILGTDEECGFDDMKYYFEREKAPVFNFSPDGSFPVVNTEKGRLAPTFSKTWSPSSALPRILSINGGFLINVIPAEAEALIQGLSVSEIKHYCDSAANKTRAKYDVTQENNMVKIAVHGKGEHASSPENGLNAITALFSALIMLPLADSESFTIIKELNKIFPHGDFYGKAAGIAQSDDISGTLTLSFNMYHQTLTGFTGCVDSRTPVCATKENCLDVVKGRINKLGIQMEGKLSPPHHSPADSTFIKTLLINYEQYTGNKGFCKYTGGETYVHGIEGGVCFGASMPGFESNVHGANEHTSIKNLIIAAKIYTQTIIDLCL